jgi:hypothetical protein
MLLRRSAQGRSRRRWQLTAIDIASSYAWADLVVCKNGYPTGIRPTSSPDESLELKSAGWQLQRILSDNGNEFCCALCSPPRSNAWEHATPASMLADHKTNGHVEVLHKTILDECWRPAFARYVYPRYTGPRHELDTYLAYYNTDRVHHGRLTQGRIPADIVYRAKKMEAR